MQVLGRLRRQQVPLREGDRFDIPEDGVGGDHADGGDVAGDEVFGVGPARPPPAAAVLDDDVAAQRLGRRHDRLGVEASEPAGPLALQEGLLEVVVVDGDPQRCLQAEFDHRARPCGVGGHVGVGGRQGWQSRAG